MMHNNSAKITAFAETAKHYYQFLAVDFDALSFLWNKNILHFIA